MFCVSEHCIAAEQYSTVCSSNKDYTVFQFKVLSSVIIYELVISSIEMNMSIVFQYIVLLQNGKVRYAVLIKIIQYFGTLV